MKKALIIIQSFTLMVLLSFVGEVCFTIVEFLGEAVSGWAVAIIGIAIGVFLVCRMFIMLEEDKQ